VGLPRQGGQVTTGCQIDDGPDLFGGVVVEEGPDQSFPDHFGVPLQQTVNDLSEAQVDGRRRPPMAAAGTSRCRPGTGGTVSGHTSPCRVASSSSSLVAAS